MDYYKACTKMVKVVGRKVREAIEAGRAEHPRRRMRASPSVPIPALPRMSKIFTECLGRARECGRPVGYTRGGHGGTVANKYGYSAETLACAWMLAVSPGGHWWVYATSGWIYANKATECGACKLLGEAPGRAGYARADGYFISEEGVDALEDIAYAAAWSTAV